MIILRKIVKREPRREPVIQDYRVYADWFDTLECGCQVRTRVVGQYLTESQQRQFDMGTLNWLDTYPNKRRCKEPSHLLTSRSADLFFARKMAKRLRKRAKERGLSYP